MDSLQEGPFKISEVLGPVTYQFNGRYTMCFMENTLSLTKKLMFMEKTSLNLHLILSMERNNTK